MADPSRQFSDRRSDPDGVGPYAFELGTDFGSGSLASGDSATIDLRTYTARGTAGYYVVLSEAGYDNLEVENRDVDNPITVHVNEANQLNVPANTIQGLGQAGMYRFTVENRGSTPISSGDVVLEIQKEPLGADEAARRRSRQPPVAQIFEKFTGITPGL